jgi:hypothetical protein
MHATTATPVRGRAGAWTGGDGRRLRSATIAAIRAVLSAMSLMG